MPRGALPDKIFALRRVMVAGFTNLLDRREVGVYEFMRLALLKYPRE